MVLELDFSKKVVKLKEKVTLKELYNTLISLNIPLNQWFIEVAGEKDTFPTSSRFINDKANLRLEKYYFRPKYPLNITSSSTPVWHNVFCDPKLS